MSSAHQIWTEAHLIGQLAAFSAWTLLVGSYDLQKIVPEMTYKVSNGMLSLYSFSHYSKIITRWERAGGGSCSSTWPRDSNIVLNSICWSLVKRELVIFYSSRLCFICLLSVQHLLWRRGCVRVCYVDVLCPNDWVNPHVTFTRL